MWHLSLCGLVFLGKTLFSRSAFCHPGKLLGQPDKMLASNLRWTSIPSRWSSDTHSQMLTEQYFHVVLFIMLCKAVLTFKSVDETLVYDHSYGNY